MILGQNEVFCLEYRAYGRGEGGGGGPDYSSEECDNRLFKMKYVWCVFRLRRQILFYSHAQELSLCPTNLNFLIHVTLQPDGVNTWYFKLRFLDLTEIIRPTTQGCKDIYLIFFFQRADLEKLGSEHAFQLYTYTLRHFSREEGRGTPTPPDYTEIQTPSLYRVKTFAYPVL